MIIRKYLRDFTIYCESAVFHDLRASLSKKRLGIFPESRLAAPRVRHAALELGPKSRAVVPDTGVGEFVQEDVVGQVRRHDDQERVKPDAAGAGDTAPDSPLAADAQAAGAIAVFAGQSVQAPGEIRPGGAAVQMLSRQDRLMAAAAGALYMSQRAPDPTQPGEGDSPGFIE